MFIKIKDKTINLQFIDCFYVENNNILFSSINNRIHEIACESKDEAKEIYDLINEISISGYIGKRKESFTNVGDTIQ
jgi:hypothetical protein